MAEPGPSGPVAFLDIGATLVGTGVKGPASRIGALLGFDAEQQRALREVLMTTDFGTPDEVAAHLADSFGADPGAAARVSREIWAAQEGDAHPLPGAPEALTHLAEGMRIGLISNIWPPYLESVRRHYGIFFDAHIEPRLQLFSFQLGMAKPTLAIFAEALRRADVTPERAVMVGDSYEEDLAPAAALGMRTVWVQTRPEDQADAIARVGAGTAPPPTLTVPSLDALDPWLLSFADG